MQLSSSITKTDSLRLKGIAILFMIYCHLFNTMEKIELYDAIFIGEFPIDLYLSRCTNPVNLFVLLSGIGLYISFLNGKKNNVNRAVKLYKYYWITLIIFLPLAFLLKKENLNWNFISLFFNFSALRTSYNTEAWFLFPYVVTSLISPFLFSILERNPKVCMIMSGLIYLFVSCITFLLGSNLYDYILVFQILMCFKFEFVLLLGACVVKFKFPQLINKYPYFVLVGIMLLLVVFRIVINNGIMDVIYSLAIVVLGNLILNNLPNMINICLRRLGAASTFIWLIHTWISWHLFKDFTYSFKYSLLIIIAITVISYCFSLALMKICAILRIK